MNKAEPEPLSQNILLKKRCRTLPLTNGQERPVLVNMRSRGVLVSIEEGGKFKDFL